MTKNQLKMLGLTSLIAGVIACGDKSDDADTAGDAATDDGGTTDGGDADADADGGTDADGGANFEWPAGTADAVANYSAIVLQSYLDSVTTATELNDALKALVASPSASNLEAAKEAWKTSRIPYLQTEVYRFYEGPIDNEENGPEGLINAWPLDELYIDYVVDSPDAGMINDTSITIDAATLEAANEDGGDANIATGYHAIEFLLWGQDLSEDGPGNRPFTDYVVGEGATAENQDRRGLYLTTVGDMLVDHLTSVHDQWVEGAAYRTEFESDTASAIEKMLTGMIILSGFETGGERLQAALDAADQEEEHSCFSDNTHVDMIEDVQGVHNVWNGTYGDIAGTSLASIVAEVDADLATRVSDKIDESLALANDLPVPFDNAIAEDNVDGRAKVEALVVSLQQQEAVLQEVFDLLGLSVEIPTE